MYPDWATMEDLISITHLDESVIKTWFKNQRVKRKKEQQSKRSNSSQESPNPTIPGEEEPSLCVTSTNTHCASPSISDASDHELPRSSKNDQPGPSRWGSPWDSQPPVLQEICLGDFDPPWASSPYDMGQLIQLYALPGDDDPSSLDQYLSPTCHS
uniref:Homeobox domain-containing protein n=1 Tax=Ursus maritimus TaxID=29073 RepID=A0A452V0G7_URSMA